MLKIPMKNLNSMNENSKIEIYDNNENTRSNKYQANNTELPTQKIEILCFDLTYYNKTTQFLLCCTGVFILFIVYGYMQELIFTLDGFKPYGWFLTFVQFGFYTLFSFIENLFKKNKLSPRCIPIKTYLLIAFLTLGTIGLSNASLGYLNYPTQVIFKCCKLIPVLIGSILIQKKQHGVFDFIAAITMCIGLTFFTLADSYISPNFNTFGVFLISLALLCDAAIGNVQEKAMKEFKASNNEVVYYSYGIGFFYLFVILLFTGHLISGFAFCAKRPLIIYGYAFLFSLSGYLGIQIVLTLVRTSGAPLAATVTTARKAVTMAISFMFFAKPFTMQYLWSGLIVVLGIYLNVYSKKNKITLKDLIQKIRQFLRDNGANKSDKRYLLDV